LGSQLATLPFPPDVVIGSGVGAGQSDLAFFDKRPLAGSANEELDLAGGLVDLLGATITFAKVCGIYVQADAANGGNIVVGGAAANTFLGPFVNATDKVNVAAGQRFVAVNMLAAGWPVTPATADLLRIENDDAGAANYDLVIIGRTA